MTEPEGKLLGEHVGRRIRLRRMELRLSQERLGAALGVTFQQVQNYERGANRISAPGLFAVAGALNVPISYFFEGLDGLADAPAITPETLAEKLLTDRWGRQLAEAYLQIGSQEGRRSVASLISSVSDWPALQEHAAELHRRASGRGEGARRSPAVVAGDQGVEQG